MSDFDKFKEWVTDHLTSDDYPDYTVSCTVYMIQRFEETVLKAATEEDVV